MSKRKTPKTHPADVGIFARAKTAPPPSVEAGYQATPGDWSAAFGARGASALGAPPSVTFDALDALAEQNVLDELLRMDVDPSVAAELAHIDPQGSYVVTAVVYGGSGTAGAGLQQAVHVDREHTIVMVGRGSRLWGRFLHLCDPEGGGSELISVEIYELASPVVNRDDAHPLWSGETVSIVGGGVVEGTGERAFWEMQRAKGKGGRKKLPLSRGGATHEERIKSRKNKRARDRRKRAIGARARALEDAGDVGAANRLRKRSEKRRKQ